MHGILRCDVGQRVTEPFVSCENSEQSALAYAFFAYERKNIIEFAPRNIDSLNGCAEDFSRYLTDILIVFGAKVIYKDIFYSRYTVPAYLFKIYLDGVEFMCVRRGEYCIGNHLPARYMISVGKKEPAIDVIRIRPHMFHL